MSLRFSTSPGRRERHLQRLHLNPLFKAVADRVSREQLDKARSQDEAEAKTFEDGFVVLIQQVMTLQPSEESDVILKIKEQLDKSYEQASGLRGEQSKIQQAIIKLVTVIMAAVRQGAQGDAQAGRELDDEDTARELHYHLLQYPLVADLLAPDSPISAEHLLPSLLSSQTDELDAALNLFDQTQLNALLADGNTLLDALDQEIPQVDMARMRLEQIERRLAVQNQGVSIN